MDNFLKLCYVTYLHTLSLRLEGGSQTSNGTPLVLYESEPWSLHQKGLTEGGGGGTNKGVRDNWWYTLTMILNKKAS